MNRELLAKAFGDIDEQLIAQAYRPAPEDASSSSERVIHMKKKRIISLALAAALILALGAVAYAAGWIAPVFTAFVTLSLLLKSGSPEANLITRRWKRKTLLWRPRSSI